MKAKLVRESLEDLNIRDAATGRTPLIMAAIGKETGTALELIDAGADVNVTSKAGRTALMHAAYNADTKLVKALLDAGADLNIKDEDWETALSYAVITSNNEDVVQMLLDAGIKVNPHIDIRYAESTDNLNYVDMIENRPRRGPGRPRKRR